MSEVITKGKKLTFYNGILAAIITWGMLLVPSATAYANGSQQSALDLLTKGYSLKPKVQNSKPLQQFPKDVVNLATGRIKQRKEQTMRAFYMIDITIKDGQKFQEYVDHAKPLVEKFGGGMLIRGRELDSDNKPVEGKLIGVMEFPSVEIARAWYNSDEYRAIIRIRDAGSISEFTLYETVKPHSMD